MKLDDWLLLAIAAGGGLLIMNEKVKNDVANGKFKAALTGYWPFKPGLTSDQRTMEGGLNDTHGNPLHTLEDFQSGQAPYVSVSGDPKLFPYGQRINIANWPGIVFRVVDTGDHFRGNPIFSPTQDDKVGKFYRIIGHEPLDICVNSPDTVIKPKLTNVSVVDGDSFAATRQEGMQDVNYDRLFGQSVDYG